MTDLMNESTIGNIVITSLGGTVGNVVAWVDTGAVVVFDAESLEDTAVELSALLVVVSVSIIVVLVSCDKIDVNKNVVMPKK